MNRPPIDIWRRLWKVSYYRQIPQQSQPILHVKWFHYEASAMEHRKEMMESQKAVGDVQVIAYKLDEVVA